MIKNVVFSLLAPTQYAGASVEMRKKPIDKKSMLPQPKPTAF